MDEWVMNNTVTAIVLALLLGPYLTSFGREVLGLIHD